MTAAFAPIPASTVLIDVANTTANVALGPLSFSQVRVMNNGSATAWVNFGDSTVTASLTTGFPVGPGATEVFTIGSAKGAPYAAAIAAASTGKIYFTPGSGN